MTCSEGSTTHLEARSIGPAVSPVLSRMGASLRVHSVFAGTVNLEVERTDGLLALTGPSGKVFPHAVALVRPVDFRVWQLLPRSRASLRDDSIWLQGENGKVLVDLGPAERTVQRPLPRMDQLGEAHRICAVRLAELQAQVGSDLRMDRLRQKHPATTRMGEGLRRAALDLGEAAQGFIGSRRCAVAPEETAMPEEGAVCPSLGGAVAALMGLGAGLTPSGDDFLCGFMAAARACRPGLVPDLAAAAEVSLHQTSRISGFLVRCAAGGFWPSPLVNLADALAGDRVPEALVALGDLGRLGHSSGTDLATGFLFGLETLSLGS